MTSTKKISPNRRRSIAVTNHSRPSLVPRGRRRAHSIVPGTVLSPSAKARRSLAPRKSILKAFVNTLSVDPSSQSTSQSHPTAPDDGDITRSMDITQDFTPAVHDYTSRKSLSRRVSWANISHVRFFDKRKSNQGSSPSSVPSSDDQAIKQNSNENDYPGQTSRRRRSSARYSLAQSEDMDLTSVTPGTFATRGSAILDEEFDYGSEGENEGDDMDVTEAVRGNFSRKRSLSLESGPHEADESRSDVGNNSMQSVSEQSEGSYIMDFTVPLGQTLRPAEQDEAWLALKQVTHSGGDPSEPELSSEDEPHDDMDLDDAMVRLRRARDSLSLHPAETEQIDEAQDDSFTSSEDSFNDDIDNGNRTLNLSQVMGRVSLGPNARMSFGQDSNMDESEVYGNIVASTPRPSLAALSQSPVTRSSVFKPPEQGPSNPTTPTTRRTATSNSRPGSPSKSSSGSLATSTNTKSRPSFTAAFAPPTARPSPKKTPSTPTDSRSSVAKRPRTSYQDENIDSDRPSPAKRQALAGKWLDVAEKTSDDSPTSSDANASKSTTYGPKPLSPSKKAPFQAPPAEKPEPTSRPSALRRPSGYFAKRKSLAVGFASSTKNDENVSTPAVETSSQKKKLGRASLGSAPSTAWTRFNKDAALENTSKSRSKEIDTNEQGAEAFIREAPRHVDASSSPARASSPPKGIVQSEPSNIGAKEPPQEVPAARLSTIAETPEVIDVSTHVEIDVEATQQWREGVQAEFDEEEEEEEVPSISISQFFSMTGIKFMDELTAPRRSIHPSQQPVRQPRNPTDIPLAEYVTAMGIDIPQLDLYSRVSKDLEGWMAKSKMVFSQAEEEAAKVTPELFVEYVRADEEGRNELLHQLNLIRTHTRFLARSDWYDWKLQWVEGLRITADEAFASLEADARALEDPKKAAMAIVPALEKEYEELMRELEQEQAEVAEIEGGDQDYLNELKATIAEQNIEIEALKAELTEGTDQVRWLQERTEEIDVQRREAKNTITTAQRILHMKQTSTRSEVFRLKGELEALEDLHMCRITKVHADIFEYIYASQFHISIPCKHFVPIVTKVTISRSGHQHARHKDDFPRLSAFLMHAAQRLIADGDDLTVREIVHRLSDYWSSCAQLRSQLRLLSIKYPVEVTLSPPSKESPSPSFAAKCMVIFPAAQAKAFISFNFSFDTFSQWPISMESLDCDVEVVYGSIDRTDVLKAVSSRLSEATPSDNYACLLDACIEAQELYH
ncbi:Spc7 kinetochore protein-domain-containing protein [Gymnopilus junonius]|uniref:Spc7 kinetochore protein-domain-containing protein n=1 Tax=Gymnopilus junonius TaxID=109634 RepID=A0A9P5NSR0_GYMJU|nr:Spc7 kinetochore protein-domain-containing protein [Gymnopilus junonius]